MTKRTLSLEKIAKANLDICCNSLCNSKKVEEYIEELEKKSLDLDNVSRVEVIGTGLGRAMTHYLHDGDRLEASIQDDGKTLKLFIVNESRANQIAALFVPPKN